MEIKTIVLITLTVGLVVYLAYCIYKNNEAKGSYLGIFERRSLRKNYYIVKENTLSGKEVFCLKVREPVLSDDYVGYVSGKRQADSLEEAKAQIDTCIEYYKERVKEQQLSKESNVVWDGKTVTQ